MAKHLSIKWDDEKDDALKTFVENNYDDWEIAEYFGLDCNYQIKKRRYQLGILRRPARGGHNVWSTEDIDYLRKTLHLTAQEVSQHLDKSKIAIEQKRSELGLKSTSRRRWQPWELQLMKEKYPARGAQYIAAKTGWYKSAIWAKACQLGLVREKR